MMKMMTQSHHHHPPPQDCSSPVPSASVSSRPARRGKKREHEELLDYMEKADDKFLQLNKDMVAKMEADTSALLGLMGRMVAVMEAQANKCVVQVRVFQCRRRAS
ncbi:hypothetical protein FQN60_006250 [Etheostoma spectabile]|uniref:Uncharacterized protein n=1 Tax=Etheostoma spectabile TaxID=54343 RepID=A0A5J5CNR2_9PERO|nr:hypothetical protein FQN60_006250 [Etheostoma spectabile]